MRKIIISVVVCLCLILTAVFFINGVSAFNVKGIKGLSDKNKEIDEKISELSNTIGTKYYNTESNLNSAANTLQKSKTEYENQYILSSSNSSSYISQLEFYDIDYLWAKLGNHANSEGVVINLAFSSSGTTAKVYDINFTVTGQYTAITNFIYDIEKDSKLGFKIDNFLLKPSEGENLNATFTCKDIPVNIEKLDSSSNSSQAVNSQSNNTNTSSTGAGSTDNSSQSGNKSSANSSANTSGGSSASKQTAQNTQNAVNTSGGTNTIGNVSY